MVKRFLLDRINAEAAGTTVGGQNDLIVLIGTHETETMLAFVQLAEAGTEIALDPAILQPVPILGRNNCSRCLFGHAVFL